MSLTSLYDAASLWMTPSGRKEGKVYSEKPVPVYGAELVTNGDFATDSNWTKGGGATISGGKANIIGDGSTYVSITQNSVFTTGKKYRVSADVEINSGLGLKFQDGATNENIGFATSSGTYVFDFIAGANTSLVIGRRTGGTAFNSSVDNISVKEISNDGDFTFTRGSNLSATRVDASQLIEKGRENVLLQSNQFDTTWTNGSSFEESGFAGYDGTDNAWKITKTGAAGYIRQVFSSGGVQTFSVYVKADTSNYVALYIASGTSASVWFNLTNGNTDAVNNAITSSIESVGNGWYRCSLTANLSLTDIRIYPAEAASGVGAASGSLFIQDAQVEQGLVATPYIETGATTAQAGILEDTPRFDYSGGATCPSLLLEPSRTNLMSYSEYFGTYNAFNGASITSNYSISPQGYNNATRLELNSISFSRIELSGAGTSVANKNHTVSCYVKSNGADTDFRLKCTHSGVLDYYSPNLTATSEWQRFTFTQLFGAGASNAINAGISNSTDNAADLSIYGFQLEQNSSYATSYIPTYGSPVTRSREISSLTGFDFFPNGEGTALIEFEINETAILSYPELFRIFNPSDSTSFLYCYIYEASAGDVRIGYRLDVENSKKIEASAPIALGTNKLVVRLQKGAYTAYLNGAEIAPSQEYNDVADVNMTTLRLYAQTEIANERIKQLLTFPIPLTDSELTELTINGVKEELIAAYKTRVTTLEEGASERLDTYLQSLEDFIII